MPEIILFLVLLAPLWLAPIMTAYYASTHNRSFKKWLLIGFLLPVISLFIVAYMPDKKDEE
jgi:hypothetical protein